MELIQIIYSILIYGGALLLVVVLFSFWISKARQNDSRYSDNSLPLLVPQRISGDKQSAIKPCSVTESQQPKNQKEQSRLREILSISQPQIFPIDQVSQRELKIIRKPTFHAATEHTKESALLEKNNLRYTIVNEQMKNAKSRAFNFYL